eukprot:SAG11_NODE_30388_length_301_cov_1.262376_1_plen_35_part_10
MFPLIEVLSLVAFITPCHSFITLLSLFSLVFAYLI